MLRGAAAVRPSWSLQVALPLPDSGHFTGAKTKNYVPSKIGSTVPSSIEKTTTMSSNCNFQSLGCRVERTRCNALARFFCQGSNLSNPGNRFVTNVLNGFNATFGALDYLLHFDMVAHFS